MALELENLEERYQNLQATLEAQATPPSLEVVSLIDRLSRLVQEAQRLSAPDT